jgi:micrococcal nuclease
MPKSKPFSIKTPLIVLAALIALALCILISIKLLSLNQNENNTKSSGENETLILRAVDGDTLELAGGETIRLLCVDTPEEGKEGYEEAKDFLSSLVLSGEGDIRIEPQGFDNYNRTLAWIYSGETLVNKEIIDNGYGTIFPYNGTNCSRVE